MEKISPFAHRRMDHTFTAWLFIQNGIKELSLCCLHSKLQMAKQKERIVRDTAPVFIPTLIPPSSQYVSFACFTMFMLTLILEWN